MRILYSIHLYPPVHNCGSEWMAHHINKFLIAKGHHVRVILHQALMHNVRTPYDYEGVEVIGPTGDLDAYRWADVIITHLDFTQFTLLQAMQINKPIVHFVHNDIQYSSIVNSPYKNQFIVYNSMWIANKKMYDHRFTVLHPPCDQDFYDVNKSPIDSEFITLISLNQNKGGELFYKIAEAMPDKKFLGVMGSYDEQIVKQLPNVMIYPNTPDIREVYKMTRALLMPSYYESWGRTATEAMCSGIPVICTPTPGLKENCGTAGIYVGKELKSYEPGQPCVDRGKVEDWVKQIRRLDNVKYYNEVSRLSKERANELNPVKELENLETFLCRIAS